MRVPGIRFNRQANGAVFAAVVTAFVAVAALTVSAYVSYGSWASSAAYFYVNPANADMSNEQAEATLVGAMQTWNEGGSAFRFHYGGRVNDTSTGYDNRNVAIFRSDSNGSTIATTYWWTSNATGEILDADIIFWDGGWRFFTGTSGCESGIYLEDVAAHEFGHSLGLRHSADPDATMYAIYYLCTQTERTLADDDVAGLRALYGGGSAPAPPVTNTVPSVSITSPSSGLSIVAGTSVTFSGSASDAQDGNLSSQLLWTSSLNGTLGTGSRLTSSDLFVGTHTITAWASDSAGQWGYQSVAVTVNAAVAPTDPPPAETLPPPSSGPTLGVRGYKVKGLARADLTWSGASSTNVDILRNGVRITTGPNDLRETDYINKKGAGSYTYQLCEASSSTCSNKVTVSF